MLAVVFSISTAFFNLFGKEGDLHFRGALIMNWPERSLAAYDRN